MNLTLAYLSSALHFVLGSGFLILILCGFFEDREQGSYRFRYARFVVSVVLLLIANAGAVFIVIPQIKKMVLDASHVAEASVVKNRLATDYTLRNMSVLFPEILNDQKMQCYRAALSNYVEDDWNKSFTTAMWQREGQFCKTNAMACNGKQEDAAPALRQRINPFHLLFRDFAAIGLFLGTDWTTAAESYKKMRQFMHQPDGKGNILPPPDKEMLVNYQNYWSNCASLKPLPWVTPNEPLLQSPAIFCIGNCP
jgi:hypothetical protein